MKKEMLINVLQPEEIRIAILEDGVLEELYVERTSHESYVGNIYKGRIVNIEPSIQAAFVDFGVGRNGFLHVSDVEPAYYRHLEQGREPSNRRDRGRGEPRRRGGDRRPAYDYAEPTPDDEFVEEGILDRPFDVEDLEPPPDASAFARAPGEAFDDDPDAEDLDAIDDIEEHQAALEEDTLDRGWPTEHREELVRDDSLGLYTEEAADERSAGASESKLVEWTKPEGDKLPVSELSAPTDESAAEEEMGAVGEAPAEDAPAEGAPRRRGRRKASAPRGRSRKGKGERAPKGAEVRDEDQAGEEDRPRPMESAERRTDEEDGPENLFADEDLSFSMADQGSPAPAARPEDVDDDRETPPAAPREQEFEDFSEDDFDMPPPRRAEPQREDRYPRDDRGHRDRERGDRGGRGRRDRDDRGGRGRDRGDRGGRDRGDRRGPGGRDDRRGGRAPRGRDQGRTPFGRPKPLIQDIFKRGQEVLVQVIKEGIGTKGPTLSTYISIAGRYLVLMPGLNRIGVSRKIADDDVRRRLRDAMRELQPPPGLGFIIRTAGQDRNKRELQRDLIYLSRLWKVVARRIKKQKSPCEIYQESDMITRTIRDIFTNDIQSIYVDEPSAYEHAKEFLEIVMPRFAERIKLWDSTEPMFYKHGIESEINRIQQRHVPLPNGGSIVIDQAEALVAIDVNSGNFRADNNAEETAYQMNLLAAKEIARQLRLRDLGGVIVNDFIDMRDERHRRNVERALRDAVRRDRARTKILRISQFGIIEMTRQRIRPSLKRSVFTECPHCKGTSQVKTCESMSIDVMRLLQLASHRENYSRIEVRVEEEVAHYLLNRKRAEIAKLEEKGGKQIFVRAQRGVAPEHMEFTCQDQGGNEVKFNPFEEPRPLRRLR